MPIELKQSLRLSQQLVITPQLQQAIKLLQLSRLELVEMVQSELLENPILEEVTQEEEEEVPAEMAKEVESEPALDKGHEQEQEVGIKDGEVKEPKEFDWENYIQNYSDSGPESRQFRSADEIPTFDNLISKPTTLQDHLEWQLHMASLTDEEDEIGLTLIGTLDDNGYLTIPIEQIAEKNGYDLGDVQEVLKVIQEFDPVGVGARDLKECLLLQARHFGKEERPLLEDMINNYLPLLEKRDFAVLARKLKVSLEEALHLGHIISALEPKPGRPYGGNDAQYITPDVFVYKSGTNYIVVLNEEGLPRLHVSNFYRNMLISKNGKGKMENKKNGNGKGVSPAAAKTQDTAQEYIEDKLKKAVWLIKSIHQRQRTLYRVAKCIVECQKEFFDNGVSALKPMVLKDVAEKIGVHESTVSRATSNKYMYTPQGIYELKFFFNSRIANSSPEGEGVASETVKEKIRKLVANENAKQPFSDKEIADLLKTGNINIARRTVAKYRETLGILPSSRRRQLY